MEVLAVVGEEGKTKDGSEIIVVVEVVEVEVEEVVEVVEVSSSESSRSSSRKVTDVEVVVE